MSIFFKEHYCVVLRGNSQVHTYSRIFDDFSEAWEYYTYKKDRHVKVELWDTSVKTAEHPAASTLGIYSPGVRIA